MYIDENNTLYHTRRLYSGSVPEELTRNYPRGLMFKAESQKDYAAKTTAFAQFYVSEVYNILKDDIRNMDVQIWFDAASFQMKFSIIGDVTEEAYARYLFMKGE